MRVRLLAFARGSTVEEQTDDAARHRIAAHAAVPAKGVRHTEIHFTDGAPAGLELIGFAIWERKHGGRTVTFPAASTP